MATPKQVTEPATPAVVARITEPSQPDRVYDPRKKVKVYDTNTKQVVRRPVPETWLDGRFPNLAPVPSSKEGK
ncbi:hypothetical protein CQ012_02315 [Arthrobacter sp. MYb214]|uniref:hypothetical protein n=1 Tax=Arthrobacter sp. MYb214 TaxID=1848596 RepID=UPI000CFB69B4|nr:hypothetical protein [Arthrobacter sp. MYb214]PRB78244.1 hypothetical protein CQ012_02315 [Arthrobacter sp. MYb214]